MFFENFFLKFFLEFFLKNVFWKFFFEKCFLKIFLEFFLKIFFWKFFLKNVFWKFFFEIFFGSFLEKFYLKIFSMKLKKCIYYRYDCYRHPWFYFRANRDLDHRIRNSENSRRLRQFLFAKTVQLQMHKLLLFAYYNRIFQRYTGWMARRLLLYRAWRPGNV